MPQESIVLYLDQIETIAGMEPEDTISVLRAICEYKQTGNAPELSPAANIAFRFIRAQIDRDAEKWEQKRRARSEAGKKGGRPRKQMKATESKKSICFSEKANHETESKDNICFLEKAKKAVPVSVPVPVPVSTPLCGGGNKGEPPQPTPEEVRAYCLERNSQIDPARFYDYYQSRGWCWGGNPITDWKAVVRNWERNPKKGDTPHSSLPSSDIFNDLDWALSQNAPN